MRRILNNADDIDLRALYPAKVVAYNESGSTPSGVVDLNVVDQRIKSVVAVPVLPPMPGVSYVPLQGTQCLLGWQGGDERYPYATGWPGQGGCSGVTLTASGHVDVVSSSVNLGAATGTQAICIEPLATALKAFASSMSTATTLANVLAAGVALNTAISAAQITTTKTKAA